MSEGKTGTALDEEIGALVGLAGTSLQRYRSGAIPNDPEITRVFAEVCVTRGLMGRLWLEQFLQTARFPPYEGKAMIARLFPEAPAATRPAAARPNIPPPTYARFIMRRAAYDAALAGLASAMPLTVVVSMGGMGKSTLAQVIARDCLEGRATPTFRAAVWVSDRGQPGSTSLSTFFDEVARVLDYPGIAAMAFAEKRRAIEDLLGQQPILLVFDNAETMRDSALLEWLASLPTPSKALVTSRNVPQLNSPLCLFELEPMDAREAQAMIAERIAQSPLRHMAGVAAQLAPLAEAACGNPKAIALAIGLVQRRSLDEVLADLRAGQQRELFDDLFAWAWDLLDAAAQRVLVAVTLFPASVDADALGYSADLPAAAAQRTLAQLADLSLIDVERADDLLAAPRYNAHPLCGPSPARVWPSAPPRRPLSASTGWPGRPSLPGRSAFAGATSAASICSTPITQRCRPPWSGPPPTARIGRRWPWPRGALLL